MGCGEIARSLVKLADNTDCDISVSDTQLEQFQWPARVTLVKQHYNNQPWLLPAETHAVIARGHDEDVQSVVTLLNHHATHVYLVASARRAQSVISEASSLLKDKDLLTKLSAPAGLSLGGNSSSEIALSILAEIQWRIHQNYAGVYPLSDLRESRLDKSISGQRNQSCPGKRP